MVRHERKNIPTSFKAVSGVFSNTMLEEVQDRVAWFKNSTVFSFPMREGSVLSLNVALAENLKGVNDFGQLFSNVCLLVEQHGQKCLLYQ